MKCQVKNSGNDQKKTAKKETDISPAAKSTDTKATNKNKIIVKLSTKSLIPPARFNGGLKVGWWVTYKNDGKPTPYHSVRDMMCGMQNRGVKIESIGALRAFIRRRRHETGVQQKSFAPFAIVERIEKAGENKNLLALRFTSTDP